jgi:hypothetical protein
MEIFQVSFMTIWYTLWAFALSNGNFYILWTSVILPPFWYIVSRKIWQPCCRPAEIPTLPRKCQLEPDNGNVPVKMCSASFAEAGNPFLGNFTPTKENTELILLLLLWTAESPTLPQVPREG